MYLKQSLPADGATGACSASPVWEHFYALQRVPRYLRRSRRFLQILMYPRHAPANPHRLSLQRGPTLYLADTNRKSQTSGSNRVPSTCRLCRGPRRICPSIPVHSTLWPPLFSRPTPGFCGASPAVSGFGLRFSQFATAASRSTAAGTNSQDHAVLRRYGIRQTAT